MRNTLLTLLLLALAGGPATAASFYISTDVPTDVAGVDYLPWDVVRQDGVALSVVFGLPAGADIDALHRMDSGEWLFSFESATDLGGATYDPRDITRLSGGSYFPFFCGGSLPDPVPAGSNVDAAYLDGGDNGTLVISFDVPTTVGPNDYDPADLVRFERTGPTCADWTDIGLAFDASAATPAVPRFVNIDGADVKGSLIILSLDIPVTLGVTFLPGDLVTWDGVTFSTFSSGSGAGWPIRSRIDAVSMLAGPGIVPPTLAVTKVTANGSIINLDWDPSCSAGSEDYGMYEGKLGVWYSHASIDCSDDGADLNEDVSTTPDNRYYLVVPQHASDEGSYSINSAGVERPPGGGSCRPTQELGPCP